MGQAPLFDIQTFNLYAWHSTKKEVEIPGFHFHNNYELLLFVQGNVKIYVEQSCYRPVPGTLFVFSPEEAHVSKAGEEGYERYIVHFSEKLTDMFRSLGTDLMTCLRDRERGRKNAAVLSQEEVKEYIEIFKRLREAQVSQEYGNEALVLAYLAELLVAAGRAFKGSGDMSVRQLDGLTADAIAYIRDHLQDDLCLETISRALYVDKFYLSHQFKTITGDSLYHYIIMRRLSLAKRLLASGCNVTETCEKSGFRQYNNFIRTFRKYVGISPGQYKKVTG